MVNKLVVLFRIEDFKQSGCRVTFVIAGKFVDFIENKHRVV